ncbi:MAG: disulfide bond formation protein B, partial [Pseudomonadota bacterium]
MMISVRRFFQPGNPGFSQPLILILIAILVLGFAYISQYGFKLQPCILCVWQRIPWWILLFTSACWLGNHRRMSVP